MLVVADATPLHYLILIAYVDLLQTLYGRVTIPQAVLDELQRPQTPTSVRAWLTQPPVWFEVQAVYGTPDTSLQYLDPGEQAAIMLAQESKLTCY
jgi:predicted nucleic acid-binding protein